MHRKIFYILFMLAVVPALLFAGTKGRIKGKVIDLQTGEPLIGANVIILGTTIGAATDASGEFDMRNIEAGTYDVKASYIGYQAVTITGVRVNADLTTELTFELPGDQFATEEVVVQAEKPLIKKDATSSVRIATSEEIKNLPVRGVNSIISLQAGVVDYNGIHLRGSRSDEVGFYLDGIGITDAYGGGRQITISNDAIEELQVETGGYSAEFGGSNGGIIRTQLRTGGPQLHASLEYITDNITFQGHDDFYNQDKRLGAYWYGYDELSATISGPLLSDKIKFFGNLNYRFDRDDTKEARPGYDYGYIGDGLDSDPVQNDSVYLAYPAGVDRYNATTTYTYTGTLLWDLNPVKFRLSGTYTTSESTIGNSGLTQILRNREGIFENANGAYGLKMTHVLSDNMYYEISGGLFTSTSEWYDRYLKDDFWNYGDSVANAEAGVVWERTEKDVANNRDGRYWHPSSYSVFGYSFAAPGTIPTNYQIQTQDAWNIAAAFNLIAGKHHTIKIGGEFKQYNMRLWWSGSQTSYAQSINQRMSSDPTLTLEEVQRSILVENGVINYGYDIFGNETDEEGFYAPHKPVFAGFYIQDKIEFSDIILNLGLRYDYIDIDNLEMVDPTRPELSFGPVWSAGNLLADGWKEVPTYSSVSPRFSVSFPVTDRTVFHAGFGKYVQQPSLDQVYNGYHRLAYQLGQRFFFSDPDGSNIRPTTKVHYSVGFKQQLTDFLAFDITGYYDDITGQVYFSQVQTNTALSPYGSYNWKTNGDFATTKGVELTLTMRRYERIAVNGSLSFQDARGTGSYPNSNAGIVGSPLDGVTVFRPQYVSPLSFNQAVRGNLNIDYRFGPNDGPAIFNNFGVSALIQYNSGHPFTRGEGGENLETDARDRTPVEPLNASVTPAQFQVDLKVDKTFNLLDKLSANVYVRVINLFDNRNVDDVWLRTGSATDDGYISNPELGGVLVNTYGDIYADIYNSFNIDYSGFWGVSRQILLGIRLEY